MSRLFGLGNGDYADFEMRAMSADDSCQALRCHAMMISHARMGKRRLTSDGAAPCDALDAAAAAACGAFGRTHRRLYCYTQPKHLLRL